MKTKKLKISDSEFVRQDGQHYCLTDLLRCTNLKTDNYKPWIWAQEECISRLISRRGWFVETCWARTPVFLLYARHLTPGLYADVKKALGIETVNDLKEAVGPVWASRLEEAPLISQPMVYSSLTDDWQPSPD